MDAQLVCISQLNAPLNGFIIDAMIVIVISKQAVWLTQFYKYIFMVQFKGPFN